MLQQQRRRRRRQRHFTITFRRFEAVEDVCGNRDTYTRLLFSLRFDTLASAHLITLFCQKSYFWVNFLFLLFAQMAAQWPCHYRPETILEPPLLFFCTGIFSHFRSLTLSLSLAHQSNRPWDAKSFLLSCLLFNWTGDFGRPEKGPVGSVR